MLDFDRYLMRYGESWILQIVEDMERHRGLRAAARNQTLEDRWNMLMNEATPPQNMQDTSSPNGVAA
jgi:hypothetical protein